jgi:purine-binding chemotaxis protein CheW
MTGPATVTPTLATATAPVVFARACVFECSGAIYGVPVADVREVAQITQLTPVPRLPAHVRGVANLRGVMVPVVDPAEALGRTAQPARALTPTVLLRDGREEVGLAVQHILGLFPMAQVEPVNRSAGSPASPFATGVFRAAEHSVILLDGPALVEALRPHRLRPPDVI